MSISLIDSVGDCHSGNANHEPDTKPARKQRRHTLDAVLHQIPEPEHSGAADDDISEAIAKSDMPATMPDFRGTWKMEVSELNMASLSGLLQYLSIRGKVGDDAERAGTLDCVRSIIEDLAGRDISPYDAVAVQALAIALAKDLYLYADQPEMVVGFTTYIIALMEAAGCALALVTGQRLNDHRHFEDMTPATQH